MKRTFCSKLMLAFLNLLLPEVYGAFVSINLVYREPCFTLLYKVGDGHTYKQTYIYKHINIKSENREKKPLVLMGNRVGVDNDQ